MLTRRNAVGPAILALVLMGGVTAQGQSRPGATADRRPFRGIFGGSASPDSPHSLGFSASIFTAYDDNVLEALSSRRVRTPWLQESGWYQGAAAGLNYQFGKEGKRVSYGGHAGGDLRYYRRGDDSATQPSAQADATFDARLTGSLNFRARQSVSYSSNYNLSNFTLTTRPDEELGHDIGVPDDPNLDLFALRAVRMATTLGLAQRLGENTSLSAGYNLRTVKILETAQEDSPLRDRQTQSGALRLRHSRDIARGAQLEIGYGITFTDGTRFRSQPRVMHNVIAGINYSRALSVSRRTSLSFGTGSSIVTTERIDEASATGPRTRARLVGHAALTHQMGRTWTAQLAYARGYRTRVDFGDLYFTDSLVASLGGLVTRRLSFSAAASTSISSLERNNGTSHRGLAATAQATYAISRFLAMFATYIYYDYRFGEDVPLDTRLPRALDRQGIRIGLTTSIPLIR